jgi:hypothetical protein
MRQLIAFALMALVLAACTAVPGAPAVQRVNIPVPVPCKVTMPDAPAWAVDALPLGSDIWQQMQALRAERLQRQGYEAELEAAVRACQ